MVDKLFRRTIRTALIAHFEQYLEENDLTNEANIVESFAHFICQQTRNCDEDTLIKTLKFTLHADRLSQDPELLDLQEKLTSNQSGLFGLIENSVRHNAQDKTIWLELLSSLENDLARETSVAGRQILKAEIALVKMLMQFYQHADVNFGEKYRLIVSALPIASLTLTVSVVPYFSAFIVLNNLVQQMLLNNQVPKPGLLQTFHHTASKLSAWLLVPSNLAVLGICYFELFLSDTLLAWLKQSYDEYFNYQVIQTNTRSLIQTTQTDSTNLNWLGVFRTVEFSVVATIMNEYITKQQNGMFASWRTGFTKADRMKSYLVKLSSIDNSQADSQEKLIRAQRLLAIDLKHDSLINDSGEVAKKIIKKLDNYLNDAIDNDLPKSEQRNKF